MRSAVEEVEGVLVNLDAARIRNEQARIATTGFKAFFTAAEQNWRAGGISLLTLEEARRSASGAERNEIALLRDRVLHWIALYKALGGGWQAAAAPALDMPETNVAALNSAGEQP